ncbi:MAG: hypothetical protein ICV64_11535 [Thermoleophilia bacterium]|nr:hypothetical protein [Thermoleophilia bacterium]
MSPTGASQGTVARILLWSLADSKTSLDELRAQLPAAPAGSAWVSHEATERFGLISLSGALPDLTRVRELIGKNPEVGEEFSLEHGGADDFPLASLL